MSEKLTNEQRAHDLAITTVQTMALQELLKSSNNGKINYDIYGEYYNYYNRLLEAFNLDFPEKR